MVSVHCFALLREREGYHAVPERTQRGGLEVTDRLAWFMEDVVSATVSAEAILAKPRPMSVSGSATGPPL